MNIKFRPLLITTGIGFIIQILLILITDIPLIAMASSEATVSPVSVVTGCLSSLLSVVSTIVIGMIYPFLANRQQPLTMASGILGGAIAVILASILGTIFLLSFRWLIIPLVVELINPAVSFEVVKQTLGMNLMDGVALFFIFIGGWIMNGVIGAVGGAIGTFWINKGKQKPSNQEPLQSQSTR